MKKILCAAFILLAAIGVFAQEERTIEKSEFDAVMINSLAKLSGQSYRITTTTQHVSEIANSADKSQSTSKSVMEFAPTRKSRLVSQFDSRTLKRKTERIRIGDKIYIRLNDGEWTEETINSSNQTREQTVENGEISLTIKLKSKFETLEEPTVYKWLGTEKLNDQNTNVYAKFQKQKLINESTKSETSSIITTKYWFGDDGVLIKQETQMEIRIKSDRGNPGLIANDSKVMVWELDPNIKIEAPITEK